MLASPPLRRHAAPAAWPWRALGVAALAAAGLHLLGWACLRDAGLTGALDSTPAPPVAPGVRVRLASPSASIAPISPLSPLSPITPITPTSALVDNAPAAPSASPRPSETAPSAELATQAGPAVSTAAPHTRASPYWPADDLERSPQPELSWVVDESELERVRHARVLLKLWVSELGRIDRVELLQAEPAGDWPSRALRFLADTRMLPGVRAGQAVNATVVVEIAAEVERFQ